jgi:hypothetical protein
MSAPALVSTGRVITGPEAMPVAGLPGFTMTADQARNPGLAGYSRFDMSSCPPKGRGGMNSKEARLDQGEAWTFLRQLEDIDKVAYLQRYPALKARMIIPTFQNVAAWARVYTYRGWTPSGSAKVIGNAADDLPMADLTGQENSQTIKLLGGAYGFDLMELRYAAATDTPIDQMRAVTCRQAMEQLIDTILAVGNTDAGLYGILKLDASAITSANRVTSYTLSTKAASGSTYWGTLAAPVATGQEVANDLIGIASDVVNKSKGIWQKVKIALSINGYNYAAGTRINAVNDTTALQFALKSEFIEDIVPWYQCTGQAANGTDDRMVAFPSDPTVLGGIVPMEWTPQPVQQKNLAFVVPCIASCGGVVVRYPIAMRYGDSY